MHRARLPDRRGRQVAGDDGLAHRHIAKKGQLSRGDQAQCSGQASSGGVAYVVNRDQARRVNQRSPRGAPSATRTTPVGTGTPTRVGRGHLRGGSPSTMAHTRL